MRDLLDARSAALTAKLLVVESRVHELDARCNGSEVTVKKARQLVASARQVERLTQAALRRAEEEAAGPSRAELSAPRVEAAECRARAELSAPRVEAAVRCTLAAGSVSTQKRLAGMLGMPAPRVATALDGMVSRREVLWLPNVGYVLAKRAPTALATSASAA